MQEKELKDRRIFARIPVELPLKLLDSQSNKESVVQTQDISAQGIGIVAREDLAPNTRFQMWLEIPDKGKPLYTEGEVVWSKMVEPNRYRAGINLDKPDLMGMSRILRVI